MSGIFQFNVFVTWDTIEDVEALEQPQREEGMRLFIKNEHACKNTETLSDRDGNKKMMIK